MKLNNGITNILRENHLYFLIISSFILLFFLNSIYRYFDHDEFEAIHSAWKILNGEIIYIDFVQHHHPFFYYTMAPLLEIFGESIQSILFIRIVIFVLFLLILITTYNIAIKLFDNKRIALISVIFLSSMVMFFNKVIEIRPDVPQVLFGLLAIYFFIIQSKTGSKKYTILSAISLGISFLFLQKIILLAIGILALQLFRIYKGKSTLNHIFIFWFSFTLPLIPYIYYLISNGFMNDYVLWNWLINMKFKDSFLPFGYLENSLKQNIVVWIFFMIGLFFSRKYIVREFCVLSLVMLLFVFLVKAPYQQYYLMFLPLMAIVAGYGVNYLIKSNKVIIIIVVIAIIPPMLTYAKKIIVNKNTYQLEKIEFVLLNTTKDDYVYDGNIWFNVFRKDIDFFWYSVHGNRALDTYRLFYPYEYNIYESINKFKPRIISSWCIDNMDNEIISNNYYYSPKYKDILIRKLN